MVDLGGVWSCGHGERRLMEGFVCHDCAAIEVESRRRAVVTLVGTLVEKFPEADGHTIGKSRK